MKQGLTISNNVAPARPVWYFHLWILGKIKSPKFSRFQLVAHLAGLAPLAWLAFDWWRDNLTVNPIQNLTLRTGKYALVFLILSLACTPANTLFGFRPALKVRRPLGLYAFLYASLHFLIFVWVDYGLDLHLIREAIFEKPYALVGFSAFLILVSLAITSTRGWMRRLGKNWTRLHRLVYLAGLLVIVHYLWLVKADLRPPILYGSVILVLLTFRLQPVRRFIGKVRWAGSVRVSVFYRKLQDTLRKKRAIIAKGKTGKPDPMNYTRN
jgi:sulfoxide reductase heme-binding subunit YedZ